MARRGLFPLVVVALTVLLGLLVTQEGDQDLDPKPEQPQAQERPDFFLETFKIIHHGEHGERQAILKGQEAEHFPRRGELELVRPFLRLRSQEGAVWHLRAPRGTARQDQGHARLYEAVAIHRLPHGDRGAVDIRTRSLQIDWARRIARTEAPVWARYPFGVARGEGMTLDYGADQLQLHARAQGRYDLP